MPEANREAEERRFTTEDLEKCARYPRIDVAKPFTRPSFARAPAVKKMTEVIAEEEKKAVKLDTTSITVVLFHEVGVPDIYMRMHACLSNT